MDQITPVSLIEVLKVAREFISGLTMHFIMVTGKMDLSMEKAPTHGQMDRHTEALGLKG